MAIIKNIFKTPPASPLRSIRRAGKKKYLFVFLLVAIVVAVFIFPVTPAQARDPDSVGGYLLGALGNVLLVVLELFGGILTWTIRLLIEVAQYNNFVDVRAVDIGWIAVRDICNLAFVIVLLMIAIGTILNVQTYHFRNTIGRFILMVILINFSKLIAGFLIDISQVVMLTFVNAFKANAANNLLAGLGVKQMMQLAEVASLGQVLQTAILALILIIIATVVVFVLSIVLIERIIMLWILVVLSPLAYFAAVIPATKPHAARWWQAFGKWTIKGPVLAFFLWLAFTIMSQSALGEPIINIEGANGNLSLNQVKGQELDLKKTEIAKSPIDLFNFIVTIGLLIAALMSAQQGGAIGGQLAGRAVNRIQTTGMAGLAPIFGAGRAARAGAGKLISAAGRKTFLERPRLRAITPSYWRGFFQRGQRLKEIAQAEAAGAGEDLSEKVFKESFGRRKGVGVRRREMAERDTIEKTKSDRSKELGKGQLAKEKMQEMSVRAYYTGGKEGRREKAATLEMATELGNFDDVYEAFVRDGHLSEKDAYTKKWGFVKEMGEDFNQETDRNFRTFAMGYMGLKRDKFDPEKIFFDKNAKLFNTWRTKDEEDWTKDERSGIETTLGESRKEAMDNAVNASEDDKYKLRALYTIGQRARDVGHWEQSMAGLTADGDYYIWDSDQAFEDTMGEAQKRGTRPFLQGLAPHNMRTQIWNAETGQMEYHLDPATLSKYQKKFWKYLMKTIPTQDFHHVQSRIPQILMGYEEKVAEGQAIFDEHGAFVGKDKNEFAEDWFNKYRNMNEVTTRASYRTLYYGTARATDKPVPGDTGWSGSAVERESLTEVIKVQDKEIKELEMEANREQAQYDSMDEATKMKEEGQKLKESYEMKRKGAKNLKREMEYHQANLGTDILAANVDEGIAKQITTGVDIDTLTNGINNAIAEVSSNASADISGIAKSLEDVFGKVAGEINKLSVDKPKADLLNGINNVKDASAGAGEIKEGEEKIKLLQVMKELMTFLKTKSKTTP